MSKSNFKLPANTVIYPNGYPRLTCSGWVGSAQIDPYYAVKVKGKDIYVDVRDFFDSPAAGKRDLRRNKAVDMVKQVRQWNYAHAMASQANIPMEDVIYLSNDGGTMVSATITDIAQHLIGLKHEVGGNDPKEVLNKIRAQFSVRVAYQKAMAGGRFYYTTRLINPQKCKLHWQDTDSGHGAEISEWPAEKNGIEENNLVLEVPDDVVFANAPQWMAADLQAYRKANGAHSLTMYLPTGWKSFWSKFKKGFMTVVRKIPEVVDKATPVVKKVVDIAKMIGEPGDPNARCELYRLGSIDDLMRELQSRPGFPENLKLRSIQKTMTPIAQGIISVSPEATGDAVSRNGYTINDLEITRCQNFAEFCRHEGYGSIRKMLNDSAGRNRTKTKYLVRAAIAPGIKDLYYTQAQGDYGVVNPSEEEELPDEEDYRISGKSYPLDPADVNVASMDITGIGGKLFVSSVDTFPQQTGEEPASNGVRLTGDIFDFEDGYSVGNSIPRILTWKVAPDFRGTEDDVGLYLQYSEFDWSRINLYLEDDNGFCVPCNTSAVSVLNFDTTKGGVSGIATLKFVGQGSTVITAPFEYRVITKEIVSLLSDSVTKEVQVGTHINPAWLVNVASDSPVNPDDPSYKNLGVLTPSGYEIKVYDSNGDLIPSGILPYPNAEYEIRVNPRVADRVIEGITSTITVTTQNFFMKTDGGALTPDEIRARYRFVAWIDDAVEPTLEPLNTLIHREDVCINVFDRVTNIPVYSGRVIDLVDTVSISLNDEEITTNGAHPVAGLNTFKITTNPTTERKFQIRFSKSYWYKPSQIKFELKDESKWKLHRCLSESDVLNAKDNEYSFTKDDFTLTIISASAGTPITLDDGTYDIELGSPFIYETDAEGKESVIGKVKIHPCNIVGLNPTVYGGAPAWVEVPVHKNEVNGVFTLKSGSGTDPGVVIASSSHYPLPYVPRPESWFEKSTQEVTLHYSQSDGGDYPILVDNSIIQWNVGSESEGIIERFGNDLYFQNGGSGKKCHVEAAVPAHSATTDAKVSAQLELTLADTSMKVITAVFKGQENPENPVSLSYGTIITPDMLEIWGSNGAEKVLLITNPVAIWNHYPLYITETRGEDEGQKVVVEYGVRSEGGPETLKAELTVKMKRPHIIDIKVQANTTQYTPRQDIADSDMSITGVTDNNIEFAVPHADVSLPDFDTRGAEDQTGMATVQYPADGTGVSGTIATTSSKYDVGNGGGETKFELPALVCQWSHPYCYIGNVNPDLGLEMAYLVYNDGSREIVDLEDVIVAPITSDDTAEAGTIEVEVSLRSEMWRTASPRHKPSMKVRVTVIDPPAANVTVPKPAAVDVEKIKAAVTGDTITKFNAKRGYKKPAIKPDVTPSVKSAEKPAVSVPAEKPVEKPAEKQPVGERRSEIYGEDQFWI